MAIAMNPNKADEKDKAGGNTTRLFTRRSSLLSNFGEAENIKLATAIQEQREQQRQRTQHRLDEKKEQKHLDHVEAREVN